MDFFPCPFPIPASLRRWQRPAALACASLVLVATARGQRTPWQPELAPSGVDGRGAAYGEPPVPDLSVLSEDAPVDVWHSVLVDGTRWARGVDYKASFGPEGATYIPFLGSRAPRNFPVTFRLTHASVGATTIDFEGEVVPALDGDTILFDRGTLTEIYDLEPGSIEQKFRFDALPDTGEIVLRIAVESDLVGRELPERIEFSNELGAVRYGRATAIDASGASVSAPTKLTEHGLEIRVPEEFVAAARFPLVVDPLLWTSTLDTAPKTKLSPDCAYDLSTGRWLVVHEEVFSVNDRDVVWRLIGVLNPQTIAFGYVDTFLSDNWIRPSCANNNATNSFLVVAMRAPGGSVATTWSVKGRTISAAGAAPGPELSIGSTYSPFAYTDPSTGNEVPRVVEVGGDPFPTLPANYLVVWKSTPAFNSAIYWRLVGAEGGGTLSSAAQLLETNTTISELMSPSVAKSNNGSTWNLAWVRRESSFADWSLRGALIGWSGALLAPPFVIRQYFPTSKPKVAVSSCLAGTSRWAATYLANGGSLGNHVRTMLLDAATPLHDADVTQFEEQSDPYSHNLLDRDEIDVETDGNSFAVVHQLRDPHTEDAFIDVATLGAVGNVLHLSERELIESGGRRPAIASTFSGGLAWRLQLIAYDRDVGVTTQTGDLVAAFYDNALYTSFCHPGELPVAYCPCSNAPASFGKGCDNSAGTGGAVLTATGISSLGSDTMLLRADGTLPSAVTVFNQGNAIVANGVAFGQGLRCVGGAIKRLYVKSAVNGSSSAPAVGDPSIHLRSAALGDPLLAGQTRQYYAYYRDPVGHAGCEPVSTYNTTQSLQAIWIP
jgi:hypothetical protein